MFILKRKNALIAGASGLVGNELLNILLQEPDYDKVYAFVRRPLGIQHPKLIEIICDFDCLEDVKDFFAVDDVFCCLGTTIKKAKSKEAMFRIDVQYPLQLAKIAHKKGAQHYLLVSSMNANPKSLFWYPRMKGMLEKDLKDIPFEKLSILQPSLLLGDRKEFRLGESIAIKLVHFLAGVLRRPLSSRLAIEAKTVAKAMYNIAQKDWRGIRVFSSEQIETEAKQ